MTATSAPGSWLLRPQTLDPVRKPLTVCMLCGAAFVGVHGLCERIAGHGPRPGPGAAIESERPLPLHFDAVPPPSGGTVAHVYAQAPPYDPIDPTRPKLRELRSVDKRSP